MDKLVEMAYSRKMVSCYIAHKNLIFTISCDIFSYFCSFILVYIWLKFEFVFVY